MATVGTPGAIQQPPPDAGFAGQGVSYPLAYTPQGRLALSWGEQSVNDSLVSILHTAAGERGMLPDYGAKVGEFEPADLARLIAKFRLDVRNYEDRVDNTDVTTALGDMPGQVIMNITYTMKADATERTLTYPLFVYTGVSSG